MVINRLAVTAELPEGLFLPNQQTLEAIRELEEGGEAHKAETVADFKKDLGY